IFYISFPHYLLIALFTPLSLLPHPSTLFPYTTLFRSNIITFYYSSTNEKRLHYLNVWKHHLNDSMKPIKPFPKTYNGEVLEKSPQRIPISQPVTNQHKRRFIINEPSDHHQTQFTSNHQL